MCGDVYTCAQQPQQALAGLEVARSDESREMKNIYGHALQRGKQSNTKAETIKRTKKSEWKMSRLFLKRHNWCLPLFPSSTWFSKFAPQGAELPPAAPQCPARHIIAPPRAHWPGRTGSRLQPARLESRRGATLWGWTILPRYLPCLALACNTSSVQASERERKSTASIHGDQEGGQGGKRKKGDERKWKMGGGGGDAKLIRNSTFLC